MYDVYVNGQLFGTVVEDALKLFVNALVGALPLEVTITTQRHIITEESVKSEAINTEKKPPLAYNYSN